MASLTPGKQFRGLPRKMKCEPATFSDRGTASPATQYRQLLPTNRTSIAPAGNQCWPITRIPARGRRRFPSQEWNATRKRDTDSMQSVAIEVAWLQFDSARRVYRGLEAIKLFEWQWGFAPHQEEVNVGLGCKSSGCKSSGNDLGLELAWQPPNGNHRTATTECESDWRR